jgi:excisionase family DNA binding protein
MVERSQVKHQKRVLTLDEVAADLRISRGSAYEAAKRGQIPTIRIGRRLLVPAEAIEKMLAEAVEKAGALQ